MTKAERRRPARPHLATDEVTLIEEVEATPAGAQEMAAARLAVNVTEVLRNALSACKCQQQELAERLNVSPGRVSQVLADGNVRIATLGRFARALGYQARVVLDPVEVGSPPLPTRPTRAETPLADWKFSSGLDLVVLEIKAGVGSKITKRPLMMGTALGSMAHGAIFEEFGVVGIEKHTHAASTGGLRTSIKVKNVRTHE
jgi:transcriptional regulator with XRE-family HTH domain